MIRFRAPSSTAPASAHETSKIRRILPVILVSLLAVIALGGWAFASPVGGSPDDNFHMTSTWCAQGTQEGVCEPGTDPDERRVPAAVANSSLCFAFQPETNGTTCAAAAEGMVETGHGNFIGLYPPVFYLTMSTFVSSDVQTSVLSMRMFNIILGVTLVASIYLLITPRLRPPLLWGLLITSIPTGMYLVASVNPSGWAIISAATLWVTIWGYFIAPTPQRRIGLAALALVSVVMGAGARGDSAVYVAIGAVLACVLSFERTWNWAKLAVLPVAAIGIGAAFYLSSGQVNSALEGEMAGSRPQEVNILSGFLHTLPEIQRLWVGNFGMQNLGWGDTVMPAAVWVTSIALVSALVFHGLSLGMRGRKAIAVALVGFAAVFIPSWVIVQNVVSVGDLVQPRYVLPLQVIFAGVVLAGFHQMDLGLSRVQIWVVVIGLSAANAAALYKNLRRYLTGTDYGGVNLDSNIEWWWHSVPFSPNFVWAAGSLAFGLLLAFVMRALPITPPTSFQNEPQPIAERSSNVNR